MQSHILNRSNTTNKKNPDFLTSCFLYYQCCIFRDSPDFSVSSLSKSFRKIKTTPLVIIDYPNIVHILYEKYKSQEEVAKHFYQYLLKNQTQNQVVIIAKQVIIDGKSYDIDLFLNLGRSLCNNQFLSLKNLFIYQIDYEKHISSSMDDLLGHFICFVSLVYYSRKVGKFISKEKTQKHIQYLTNDKQYFDKNLFGKTREEIKESLPILLEKIEKPHDVYILEKDVSNQKIIRKFLKDYMIFKSEDTKFLECNIQNLLIFFSYQKEKEKEKDKKNITYKKINEFQKKETMKTKKRCNGHFSKMLKRDQLIPSYYLYSFIKYTQSYLKNDFYGSFSKEEIINLFSSLD